MQIALTLHTDERAGSAQVVRLSVDGRTFAPAAGVAQPAALADLGPLGELTPAERNVLRLIAAGLGYKVAAVILGVSERTIRTHVNSITSKLDVNSARMAGALALAAGLVTIEDLLSVWGEHRQQMLGERAD
jgi:DNA-binding NarL/FixJ family response regulator